MGTEEHDSRATDDEGVEAVTNEDTSGAWDLVALTPTFIESEHTQYADAIVAALDNPLVRNIALSGNYGVGKSSILQEVSRRKANQVVELSLSTLAPVDHSDLDDSVPRQATTPTNRIQQEIVKQLLYREDPAHAAGSRFCRIERFNAVREAIFAAFIAVVITVMFMLAGWGSIIATTLAPLGEIGLWVYPVIFLVGGGAAYLGRWLLHGRIHIKQFSAGPAAVTLDEKSVSYFDQYLDEIVYFFETSKYRIVIFEDIDRFNDSHIFETLRSLNTLLNAAPQIEDRPVRFIYAIKDSIFDRIGLELEGRKPDAAIADLTDPAQVELVRANRTKFFDLVIPVVPFITHRSARNLTTQILRGIKHEVSNDLVDLAGRFVPDMRLLKNVRNEFVVFRGRIFSGDGKELGLSETDLFAIMLYKSTHLSDFEVIRLGKSKLDQLYEASRTLVATNVTRIERELRATRQELARAGSVATRAKQLGDRLLERIEFMVRTANLNRMYERYEYGGTVRTADYFRTAEFWQELLESDGTEAVIWRNPSYGGQVTLNRADVQTLLGENLNPATWRESDQDAARETIAVLQEQLKFLRSADMGDLIKRPDFLVEFKEKQVSLAVVAEKLLTRGLAFELIRAGFVDRNFTLYTSTFHGDRVSPAATNFIIHHVERGLMDEHFELEPDDVDAVVRERGEQALADPSLFNIAVLDHLLNTTSSFADIMIAALVRFGSEERRFLQSYLSAGVHGTTLVERMTALSPRVLSYLVDEAELDDDSRLAFVSACLAHLAEKPGQRVNESVKQYLQAHYARLSAVTDDGPSASAARRIAELFRDGGIILPELSRLSDRVRGQFVRIGIYQMSLANLHAALGEGVGLALDEIREASREHVYAKALTELPAYLAAVDGHSPTNATEDGFATIVTEVYEAAPMCLERMIAAASPESRITELANVPEDTWPVLARENRFPSTFDNVARYLDHVGAVDADLAVVLEASQAVTDIDDTDEDARNSQAVTLISSARFLPSKTRANLAGTLTRKNKKYIAASSLPVENGPLFGELRSRNVISDSAATYGHIASTDWVTKESVLRSSPNFVRWATPDLVAGDLGAVLSSAAVNDDAKLAIVERADEYAPHGGRVGLLELARLAISFRVAIGYTEVMLMAANRVPAEQVLILLQPYVNNATAEQLFVVLRALGGDYQKLTYVGRDKPKVPKTPANLALLDALHAKGIVASFDRTSNPIRVNKRLK